MGKITYRPNKNNQILNELNMQPRSTKNKDENEEKELTRTQITECELADSEICRTTAKRLTNIKPIGDLDCDYHIYLEDYVYTYLYQFAQVDLITESSAVFLGEYNIESKEVVVRGIMPIPMDKLRGDSEWIDEEILKEIEKEREKYFKDQQIIGWMHMQPGYGTMLTMKELREHRRVFGETDSIFMLVDGINKIETLFVYENKELREQSGYYMYYERNEDMQRYMLEHPFVKREAQVTEDTVVNQFREVGKLRKAQYMQRKNVNAAVIIASIILIGLTAISMKINNSEKIKNVTALSTNVAKNDISLPTSNSTSSDEDNIKFIINKDTKDNTNDTKELSQIGELPTTAVEEKIKEDVSSQEVKENKIEVKAEKKINVSEKPVENKKEVVEETKTPKPFEEYTVKEGDTLANISYNKYGTSDKSREIAQINEIGDTDYIRIGQMLKLPVK